MDTRKKYCNFNTPRNVWLSLDEWLPYWLPDSFEDEYIIVCNIVEYSGEGFRRVQTPVKREDTLDFESVYVQDELVKATHFMLIEYPKG